MKSWNRYIPEGTSDYIFEEAKLKLDLEEKVHEVFIQRGYRDVITPTIEFYDVFDFPGRIVEQESMYKLFDKSGRILALRPDMTAPIARIAGTKFIDLKSPIKACYISNVFRINERYNGKSSETTQAGIEVIGASSVKADAEVIITGIKSLLSLGINDFVIEIGHADFFNSIADETTLDEENKEKVRGLIEDKNYTALEDFIEKNSSSIHVRKGTLLKMLPGLFGGFEVLERAEKDLNLDGTCRAINDIKKVYSLVQAAGLEKYIMFDLGIVHELNYYTGIIFRGYSNLIGQTIISGGRYDGLIANFGKSVPSTGMAIYLDSVIDIKKKIENIKEIEEKIIVYFESGCEKTAYSVCDILDSKKYKNEISLCEDKKSTLLYASNTGVNYVIYVYEENNMELIKIENGLTITKQICFNDLVNIFDGGIYGTYKDSSY